MWYILDMLELEPPEGLRVECIHTNERLTDSWHKHSFHELILLRQGDYGVKTRNGTYQLSFGEGIYYPAGCEHTPYYTKNFDCHFWLLQWRGPALNAAHEILLNDPQGVGAGLMMRLEVALETEGTERLQVLIFHTLLELLSTGNRAAKNRVEQLEQRINKTVTCIPKVEELSKIAGVSRFQLSRDFKRHRGCSPRKYLQEARIERAKVLLRNTSKPVKEIAWEVGFTSAKSLSSLFRREIGVTPTEFRWGRTSATYKE